MYICLCQPVTERDIRDAALNGCRTLRELKRELGCCGDCGRCAKAAKEVLREAVTNIKSALGSLPLPA